MIYKCFVWQFASLSPSLALSDRAALPLFTPPTSVCCSLPIPFHSLVVQLSLYSLLLPMFSAPSSSLALSGRAALSLSLFTHSSYQCLLLSSHPLLSLAALSLFTPPDFSPSPTSIVIYLSLVCLNIYYYYYLFVVLAYFAHVRTDKQNYVSDY